MTIIEQIVTKIEKKDKEKVMSFFQVEYEQIRKLKAEAEFREKRLNWINDNYTDIDNLVEIVNNFFLHGHFTTDDMLEHLDKRVESIFKG